MGRRPIEGMRDGQFFNYPNYLQLISSGHWSISIECRYL